ncbi:hypothetical protein D9Q98_006109 [Chlorella vulgaris]|uniref:Protein-S-isoprenylcysteine O-methyltransferase n=1 Tax=Chlorella vulgaris TaxID=3077 RepID=A0A9D4Z0K0_CHLVU|nr:hypothetical protein D9Q98_006109 [Chlorella vulgaris]
MPTPFACFIGALAWFHTSEFCLAAIYQRSDLGLRSWLFSKPYCVAMLLSCVEYAAELRWAPALDVSAVQWLGLAAIVVGEVVRKVAMVTAAHNFTHIIQTQRRPHHTLITGGIYSWMRHPGYAGWMVWALGTQLLLCNPLCTAGFAAASWQFFKSRIAYEDELLARFFGAAFQQYRAAVPSGVPLVP